MIRHHEFSTEQVLALGPGLEVAHCKSIVFIEEFKLLTYVGIVFYKDFSVDLY
jgi:hypothetical protein